MKKTFFLTALVALSLLATSCKSKQEISDVSGARIQAKGSSHSTIKTQRINPMPEVTRDERFMPAEGEYNTEALKNKYHVVVGSFKGQSNAKGLQRSLNAEGNNSLVVVNESGMFRVIMASFNSYTQARDRVNQVSRRFPDAWILIQKR